MAVTTEEIPLPGGVSIDVSELVKAAKAGKTPAECVDAATVPYNPPLVQAEPAAPAAPAPSTPAEEQA